MISFGEMIANAARKMDADDVISLAGLGLAGIAGTRALAAGGSKAVSAGGAAGAIDHSVEQKMPSGGMDVNYQVNYVPGRPQNNARLNRTLSQAAFMQSEKEHNDALTYYLKRLPRNANVAQVNEAIRKGIMKERELKKFWQGNRTLRDYISPSSSAVSMVKIDPSNNVVVRFGNNPKQYSYRGGANPYLAAQEAAKLVLAPSIGRAINGTWGKTHKLF